MGIFDSFKKKTSAKPKTDLGKAIKKMHTSASYKNKIKKRAELKQSARDDKDFYEGKNRVANRNEFPEGFEDYKKGREINRGIERRRSEAQPSVPKPFSNPTPKNNFSGNPPKPVGNPPKPVPSRSDPKPPPQGWVPKPPPQGQAPIKSAKEKIGSKAKAFKANVPANKQSQDVKKPSGAKVFNKSAQNKAAFAKGMKAAKANKGKAAGDPTLMNPLSGRSKASSQIKHQSKKFASQGKKDAWAKSLGEGPALPKKKSDFLGDTGKAFRNDGSQNSPAHKGGHARDRRLTVGESASAFKKEAATPQSSSPSLASKVGGAIKSVATHPTTTGFLKATGVHLGMAAMHGTNYPRVMAQHASQGPREFKPGWHGFTSPVERPKAEEGTDTKGERA